jgi:hypothetical protein
MPYDGPSALDRCLEQAGDRLNPILVREVRQWLRSRYFIGLFFLLLLLCWLAAIFEVLVPLVDDSWGYHRPNGRALFGMYFYVLTGSVFLTIPVTAFFNCTREFVDDAIEILRVTPLSSACIAWGKLQTALLQMGLFYAAVTPFICLTYLLQGIGLLTILLVLVLVGIGGTSLAVLGMALGSSASSPVRQVLHMLLLMTGAAIALLVVLSLGTAFLQVEEINRVIEGFICLTIFGVMTMTFGIGFTINNVRPNFMGTAIPFINLDQLRRIAETATALADALRSEFPLIGIPRNWAPEALESFPEKYRDAMQTALVLEHAIFDRPALFGSRNRYMTHDFARQSMRTLLHAFDLILFELSWNGLTTDVIQPRPCRLRSDGTPAVVAIDPKLLDALETSAAELARLCAENPDVERHRPKILE